MCGWVNCLGVGSKQSTVLYIAFCLNSVCSIVCWYRYIRNSVTAVAPVDENALGRYSTFQYPYKNAYQYPYAEDFGHPILRFSIRQMYLSIFTLL